MFIIKLTYSFKNLYRVTTTTIIRKLLLISFMIWRVRYLAYFSKVSCHSPEESKKKNVRRKITKQIVTENTTAFPELQTVNLPTIIPLDRFFQNFQILPSNTIIVTKFKSK